VLGYCILKPVAILYRKSRKLEKAIEQPTQTVAGD